MRNNNNKKIDYSNFLNNLLFNTSLNDEHYFNLPIQQQRTKRNDLVVFT